MQTNFVSPALHGLTFPMNAAGEMLMVTGGTGQDPSLTHAQNHDEVTS